jgi:hypothetical protein
MLEEEIMLEVLMDDEEEVKGVEDGLNEDDNIVW